MDEEWLSFLKNVQKMEKLGKKFLDLERSNIQNKERIHSSVQANVVDWSFHNLPALQLGNACLDAKLFKKIKKGKAPIDARLDLHGMNFNQAYSSLKNFVLNSYNLGYSRLLVITGKSRKSEEASLRTVAEEWVKSSEEMSKVVRVVSSAAPIHGGEGAFYFILRKK